MSATMTSENPFTRQAALDHYARAKALLASEPAYSAENRPALRERATIHALLAIVDVLGYVFAGGVLYVKDANRV